MVRYSDDDKARLQGVRHILHWLLTTKIYYFEKKNRCNEIAYLICIFINYSDDFFF